MENFSINENELFKENHLHIIREYVSNNKINLLKYRDFFIYRCNQTKADSQKWGEFLDIITAGFKAKKKSIEKHVKLYVFKKLKEYSNDKRSSIFDKIQKNQSIACIEQTTEDYEEQLKKAKKEIALLQNTCDQQKLQIEKLKLEKDEEKKSNDIKINTYLSIIKSLNN